MGPATKKALKCAPILTFLLLLAVPSSFAQIEERIKTTVRIPLRAPEMKVQDNAQPNEKSQVKIRLLSGYDVELIVDSSLSMRKTDCPNGLSRWSWCGIQAEELGKRLSPYVPKGLTITAFARNFNVYRNATPANIADLFNNPNFRGGTRLAEPLDHRLNEFFERKKVGSKPLLIAVITDGVPHPQEEPDMVINTLINASNRMKNSRDVTVVFFQIGGRDRFGREFLNFLDHNLVKNGARYDFVKTVTFEHMIQVGLSQALIESIEDFANSQKAPKSAPKQKP